MDGNILSPNAMQCNGTYLVCHLSHPLHLSGVQRSSNLLGTNGSIEYHGNQYLDLLSCGEVVVLVSVKVMQMSIMMVMVSSCQRENQEEPDWHPEPNC